MKDLLKNVRFYVLVFSLTLSVIIFFLVTSQTLEGKLQITRLIQIYALTAVACLYLSLLAGPLCYTFRTFKFRAKYLKARRALGVSTFYFALLHSSFAFFGQLGGFSGLSLLSSKYLFAISLSFSALIILSLMAATSFDKVIKKMTFKKWKILHRFIYLAGVFILIHEVMLGTHFANLFGLIPQIFFAALFFLLILEARRFDAFLLEKYKKMPRFGITVFVVGVLGVVYLLFLFL